MGKRNTVVLLSSDDEEENRSPSSTRSYSKSKSRSSVSCTNPRQVKKARRLCASRPPLPDEASNVDRIKLFSEDLDEMFTGLKVFAGAGRRNTKELWVDKYEPHSLKELAVNKKKVEEVKAWFGERLRTSKVESPSRVLVINGEAGVGKSVTIRVIASHLGIRLCDWNTPTPTIWQEYVHNSSSGIRYISKLDEFENFVERIRKYGLLPSSFIEKSKSSSILLIDDLPQTSGKAASARLKNCLNLLVRSTQITTAILITDYGKADSADNTMQCSEGIQSSLESAGACKVTFNPITNNSIKKVLSRICTQENCNLTAEQIDLIAKASGGDIRQAITSLQFFCLKQDAKVPVPIPSLAMDNSKVIAYEPTSVDDAISLLFGKDETLSLFHALGKFLHNKRELRNAIPLGQDAFLLRDRFRRLPLKMDTPEKILCQAHGQARPIIEFLHENVLDFLSEEAMDDAWAVASYLGDSDLLLTTSCGMMARYNEAENVLQSAGASVAVRGVLFANSHPLPSRWHAIRRPKLWHVEQSSFRKYEMLRHQFFADGHQFFADGHGSDAMVIATEYMPLCKWLGSRASGVLEAHQLMQCNKIEDDNFETHADEQDSEISDDEIEDW